jgi:adenylosuccinate lyase
MKKKEQENPIIKAMLKGYGEKFPSLEEFFSLTTSPEDLRRLLSPIPELGRYLNHVEFLGAVTSDLAYAKLRFRVMIEYFICLCQTIGERSFENKEFLPRLTSEEIETLRAIEIGPNEVIQAQFIETFTGHDTAAAGDFLKLLIPKKIPRLANAIEGVHFAATSEDVIGNVTGLMANNLIYHHLLPKIIDFWIFTIDWSQKWQQDGKGSLILPAFTHKQSAEPTTQNKMISVPLYSTVTWIGMLIHPMIPKFQPFSGKMGGAVGNGTCHFAAFPEFDWETIFRDFVEGFGLHYDKMTDQCSPYVMEGFILHIIDDMLGKMVKFGEDFCDLVSCPGQLFVKLKKKGQKGSSIMPGKTNLWGIEGALVMLRKAQSAIRFFISELQNYPHQGNMTRSYLFRSLGGDLMPAFIAIDRITKELGACVPSERNIEECLKKYPGMCGSSLQTYLKAIGIKDDAYRLIQEISINEDGSYANAGEFKDRLQNVAKKLNLSSNIQERLIELTEFSVLVAPADRKAKLFIEETRKDLAEFKKMCAQVKI